MALNTFNIKGRRLPVALGLLSSDWDWAWGLGLGTGIGDWDWGLRMGTREWGIGNWEWGGLAYSPDKIQKILSGG